MTTDYLRKRYVGEDAERQLVLQEARDSATLARAIFELRQKAGLTQKQLARLTGSNPSVIGQLEDDDHDGLSVSMLRRIAAALGHRVQIRLVPLEGTKP